MYHEFMNDLWHSFQRIAWRKQHCNGDGHEGRACNFLGPHANGHCEKSKRRGVLGMFDFGFTGFGENWVRWTIIGILDHLINELLDYRMFRLMDYWIN